MGEQQFAAQFETTPDGTRYRDLNNNGVMDPFENPKLDIDARVDDLVGRLSLDEKVGLMFQQAVPIASGGELVESPEGSFHTTTSHLVVGQQINHLNIASASSPIEIARWQNRLQALAETTPHGIPVTVSTDPRHSFLRTEGVTFASHGFSQWPEPLGFGAIDDVEVIGAFADTVRREYLAVGIRSALHPQIDLATEPRWGRQLQTFGVDAERATLFGEAYVRGLQGAGLSASSVAATTKHFPGGGPQKDGEDPHFPYGREQVYPGGAFELHLGPFRAAIAAGTANMMPYYGMPVGLELDGQAIEEVGFGFNHSIITDLLRTELGFDGVVVTDWGLVHQDAEGDRILPARAWGVENLEPIDRVAKVIQAGADQFGGETCTHLVEQLVKDGTLSEQRIDESVRRLLRVKFELGLFDDPYVDESAVEGSVGLESDMKAGLAAQAAAVTLLVDGDAASPVLPLAAGARVWVEGVDREAAARIGTVVDSPEEAELAIIRIAAPYNHRDELFFENAFHAGSLEFPTGVIDRLAEISAIVPVVLDVLLERPALLGQVLPYTRVLTASFGCSDEAYLDVLTGRILPRGRLPFEIPRSMAAVETSREDVPSDTLDPVFAAGYSIAGEARDR